MEPDIARETEFDEPLGEDLGTEDKDVIAWHRALRDLAQRAITTIFKGHNMHRTADRVGMRRDRRPFK
jgi:hypothetical protein